jgi:hypothetical protein
MLLVDRLLEALGAPEPNYIYETFWGFLGSKLANEFCYLPLDA